MSGAKRKSQKTQVWERQNAKLIPKEFTFFGCILCASRNIPPLVVSQAKSAGSDGETWLANLDSIIYELESMWNISVGEILSGGSHALVAYADGQNGERYALKVDMPEKYRW